MKCTIIYRKVLSLFAFLLLSVLAYTQITVTGKVTNEKGQPLPSASISVKGSTVGTKTDDNGNYTISNVKSAATLVANYVGFITMEKQVTSDKIDFVLKAADRQLDEVVVVGYGTQKKSLVTGSIASVSSKDLDNKQVTRADDALQGLTAGVTVAQSSGAPGASPMVRVRGITSINNSDPLYVVDGVVINSASSNITASTPASPLDYLNPNDIASIEVLKDAASCAIYGARASNGVVLITTKSGKFNTPATVNYNMQIGIQKPIKEIGLANATQYAELRNQAVKNDWNPANGPLVLPFANPSQLGTGTNWQKEMFGNGAGYQSHSISIQGGSDKSTYYVSAGYIGQKGIISPSNSYDNKFNLTTNTSFNLSKYVSVGENLGYTYQKYNITSSNDKYNGPMNQILNIDPITTPYMDSAAAVAISSLAVKNGNGKYYGISGQQGMGDAVNPLAYQEINQGIYSWAHNIIGNAYIKITPMKGLTLRSQFNLKQVFQGSRTYIPLYYLNSIHANTLTSEYRESDQNLTWNWDNTISYEKNIDLHHFAVLVGTSAEKQTGWGLNGTFKGEPAQTYNDASLNFSVPQEQRWASGYDDQDYALSSIFGRLSYNYNEKYLFEGIIRRDGSVRFPSNHRYGVFPSAQLGWVITREKFMSHVNWLNNLKIRASYGVVGNDMSLKSFGFASIITGSGWTNGYYFGNNNYYIGNTNSTPANPDLKWEQTASTDIGFDAIVLTHWNITFDYYHKKTTGMLQQLPIPGFTGYSNSPWSNVGDLVNNGVELTIGYKKVFNKNFQINVQGNVSYLHNEITYLGQPFIDPGVGFQNSTYSLTRMEVGQQVGAFYGYKALGIFKNQQEINQYGYTAGDGTYQMYQPNAKPGDIKYWKNPNNPDDNGKGSIGQGDRMFIGNPLPNWTYGFNFNATYKHFDLMIFGQGACGNKILQQYRRLDATGVNYSTEALQALNAWDGTNYNANYPRITDNDDNGNFSNPSTFLMHNGAYFRLKTLQVGYTLPQQIISHIGIQKLRVFASASNLFTITSYNGFDPEISTGIDLAMYPRAKTFLFGLNVGF